MAIINLKTQQASLNKTLVKSSVLASGGPKVTASKIKVSDIPKIQFGSVPKAIGSQPKMPKMTKLVAPKIDVDKSSGLGEQPFFKAPKIPKPLKVTPKPKIKKPSLSTPKLDKPKIGKPTPSVPKVDKPTPSAPKLDKPVSKVEEPTQQGIGENIVKMINDLQKSFASLSSRVDVIMSVLSKTSKTQHDQGQQLENLRNGQIESRNIQSQELENLRNAQIQNQNIQSQQLENLKNDQIENQNIQSQQLENLINDQIENQTLQNERFLGLEDSYIKSLDRFKKIESSTSVLRDAQETIINNQKELHESVGSLNETNGDIIKNQQQLQEVVDKQSKEKTENPDSESIQELQETTNNIIASQLEIKNTLQETTNILNDIGNAMSLDFADRITKEREALKKARKEKIRAKRQAAERSVEGAGALESANKGIVDTVKKPVSSLMSKIGDLLTFLIFGFINSKAMKWLRNNVGAIDSFFNFFKRHWFSIITFGFGSWIFETAKMLRLAWKNIQNLNPLNWFKGKKGIVESGKAAKTNPGKGLFGPKVTKTGVRNVPGNVTDAAFDIKPKQVSQFTRSKSRVGKLIQRTNIGANKLRKLPIGKYAGGALSVLFAAMEFKGRKDEGQTTGKAVLGTAGSTLGGIGGAKAGAAIGATIGSIIPGPGTAIGAVLGGLIGGIGGAMLGGKAADTVSDAVGLGGDTRLNKKVDKTGKLEEDDRSGVIINNAIKQDVPSSLASLETPLGGSPLPVVSPEDMSNIYVGKVKEELGVLG